MAGLPPPRYRVVERGRRLEVIDSWAEHRPASVHAAVPESRPRTLDAPPPQASAAVAAARKLGKISFKTQAWYDLKGPRELLLDTDGERQIEMLRNGLAIGLAILICVGIFWWWLLLPLFLFAGKQARTAVRTAVTRWLDGLDQATRASSSAG